MRQSPDKKDFIIRLSGHETVLQDVKIAAKEMVGRIIHKTVKFNVPGKQSSSLCNWVLSSS